MIDISKLHPCPFCGGEPIVREDTKVISAVGIEPLYYSEVTCRNFVTCGAIVSSVLNKPEDSEALTAKKWENRTYDWYEQYTKEQYDTATKDIITKATEVGFVRFDPSPGSEVRPYIIGEKGLFRSEVWLHGATYNAKGRLDRDFNTVRLMWRLQDDGGDPYVVFELVRQQYRTKDSRDGILLKQIEHLYPDQIPNLEALVAELRAT